MKSILKEYWWIPVVILICYADNKINRWYYSTEPNIKIEEVKKLAVELNERGCQTRNLEYIRISNQFLSAIGCAQYTPKKPKNHWWMAGEHRVGN